MKSKKLKLNDLKISSFVTKTDKIFGGVESADITNGGGDTATPNISIDPEYGSCFCSKESCMHNCFKP